MPVEWSNEHAFKCNCPHFCQWASCHQVLCLGDSPNHFAITFSLLLPVLNESEYTKLMTSLITNLIASMGRSRQIPGWTRFFQQQFFPSGPALQSLVGFNSAIISRSFHFNFLSAKSATPIASYFSFSNLRCALRSLRPSHNAVIFYVPIIVFFLRCHFSQTLPPPPPANLPKPPPPPPLSSKPRTIF